MEPRVYEYRSRTTWADGHKGALSSEGMREIEVACPPEFGGHVGYWTPEHLFVSSVEVCTMTTFLAIFQKSEGNLVSYDSSAVGRASIRDWVFQFTDIEITPRIVVKTEEDVDKAEEAMKRAASECLITRSLKFSPKVLPGIELAGRPNGKGDK
ncbi:MAG: OsmC family protein [bacterium]